MREIKFRVWHKPTNQFVRCHPVWNDKQYKDLGLLSLTSDGQLIFETMYDGFQRLSDSNEVDDFIVQQYTGLTDRNGQEIYEGDLLVGKNTNGKYRDIYLVDFNNENYAWLWGWNLLDYGYIGREGFVKGKKVKWNNSDKVDYPSPEYHYGKTIEEYHEVIGNVFEGIKDE